MKSRLLLIEFISIVFAVTLALGLNEWRQNRKTRNLVDRVLQTLVDETKQNLENINHSIEYREKLVSDLLSNNHIVVQFPAKEIPVDIDNDRQFETFLKMAILENVGQYIEYLEIIRIGDQRYLRTESEVSIIKVENDSLVIYGNSNIQLRTAGVRSNTWEIAQATNALIEMDYDLVMILGQAHNNFENYISISEKAINILYTGEGEITPVLEDMLYMEKQLRSMYEEILEMINSN